MKFKESDIRDLNVLNTYLRLVKNDSKKILSDPNNFTPIDPSDWGLGECTNEFVKDGYQYQICKDTGALFVNPRPKFSVLSEFYKNSNSSDFWVTKFFLPKIEARRENIFMPRAKYIYNYFNNIKSLKIADIGAGFGLFIDELLKFDNNLYIEAIEPSAEMAKIIREKNIIVHEQMLEDISNASGKYDLLTAFELFEHLYDPQNFLKDCYNLLNPGGTLFFTTLNSAGFDILTLWEKSKSIFPPHHLNFFNPKSIKILLTRIGFCDIQIETPGELDVDIVRNQVKQGNFIPDRFLATVLKQNDKVLSNFQTFLRGNNLSSHMRIIAKKQ